jgi:hypothetical protein
VDFQVIPGSPGHLAYQVHRGSVVGLGLVVVQGLVAYQVRVRPVGLGSAGIQGLLEDQDILVRVDQADHQGSAVKVVLLVILELEVSVDFLVSVDKAHQGIVVYQDKAHLDIVGCPETAHLDSVDTQELVASAGTQV